MILENARHEQFAHAVAYGKSYTDAAKSAGYSEAAAGQQGSRLACRPDVKSRIEELKAVSQERAVEKTAVDRAWILDKLRLNVERAMQEEPVLDRWGKPTGEWKYDGAVANKALELLGKDQGMFLEVRTIGGDTHVILLPMLTFPQAQPAMPAAQPELEAVDVEFKALGPAETK